MSDSITQEHRSWNMSRIRSNNTKIEVAVRKYLFANGFRFRKNDKRYPGKPDVVLPKYHTCIFVNGCFWHHHEGCRYAANPKSNIEYWQAKMQHNIENDKRDKALLEQAGWKVIILWECELKQHFENCMSALIQELTENKEE